MARTPKKVAPQWIIGIDEVGRGPLAGPVTVCAVAIPGALYRTLKWNGLTDSKKMTKVARERWYEQALDMQKKDIIKYALSSRSAAAIDTQGIAVCIRSCIASILKKTRP
jgi:ribonuclease HII